MNDSHSKTELLDRRSERDLVREGKSVLEERRDLLARTMWQQIGRVERLEEAYRQRLDRGRASCRRAIARHGLIGLADCRMHRASIPKIEWRTGNRFGTAWLENPERDDIAAAEPSASAPRPSLELDRALSAVRQLIGLQIELAQAEGNLLRLTHAFRRTQRRVNALEHIILPDLDQAISRIQSAMDEMERDDLVRASLIKRRQTRNADR
jgi:V/A-type H+-transporting ATPase subunit D